MINRYNCRQEAVAQIASRKENAEMTALANRTQYFAKFPELKNIESKIEQGYKTVINALINGATREQMETLRKKHTELCAQRDNLLDLLGVNKLEYFPNYICKCCEDTGYVDGKDCTCLDTLVRQIAYRQMCKEFPADKYRFADFSLEYYDEKEKMKKIYDKAVDFAENFSSDSPNLFLQGGTGLGKTHISLSIANEVAKKGYGVLYNSVQNFLSVIEREHFGQDKGDDTLTALLTCDLLILDDLGTEFLTQFTNSILYNIINTRYQ